MTRTIQLIIGVALLINIASAATLTVSSASAAAATNTAFNSTPVTVLNVGTNTTDQGKWGGIPAANVKYGGSLDGTKIYAYGYATTGGTSITTVVSRTLNATMVGWGNDTTEASVISDASATTAFTYTAGPVAQAVQGYLVLGYTDVDSSSVKQVYAVAWPGGASSATKVALTNIAKPADTTGAITDATSSGTSTTTLTTTAYDYNVQSIFAEDGIAYVVFTQSSSVQPGTKISGTFAAVGSATTQDTGIYVQGFYAANGTLYYTAQKTIATLASTQTAGGTTAVCGLSNYTNSTNINCLYNVIATNPSLSYTSFARAAGTSGTPATVATQSTAGTLNAADYLKQEFSSSGIISGGASASGALYSTKNTTGTGSTVTYGLQQWNTTGTAGAVASGVTTTSATSAVTAAGGPYPNGYFIAGAYKTGSSGSSYTYFIAPFASNGTAASAQATLATVDNALGNFFTDVNGSLWFGYNTYETGSNSYTGAGTVIGTNNVIQGSVGKVYKTTYSSSGSFGSVLSTFFAFMALVIATLFAF